MESKVTSVRWSQHALESLKSIYDFYAVKSEQAASNVVNDVYETAESIVYAKQYQLDETRKDCRRMVCRHYKILYQVIETTVFIVEIFDTRRNPNQA